MTSTSSARKHPATASSSGASASGKVIPYAVFGLGIVGVLIGFAVMLMGETVLSQTVSPTAGGGGTVYTTRSVELQPGMYDFSARIDGISAPLGGYGFTLTSPERSDWIYTGSLSGHQQKKRRSSMSSRRRWASGSVVASTTVAGTYSFVFTFDDSLDRSLGVRVKTVAADYRLPLYVGIVFVVLGVLLSKELREKLGGISLPWNR